MATIQEVVKFIRSKGYREYESNFNKSYERTFQKTFWDEGFPGKRFIDISLHDMSDIYKGPGDAISMNIGATFNTPLGWIQMRFYSLSSEEFVKHFDNLEAKVHKLFENAEGIRQE